MMMVFGSIFVGIIMLIAVFLIYRQERGKKN